MNEKFPGIRKLTAEQVAAKKAGMTEEEYKKVQAEKKAKEEVKEGFLKEVARDKIIAEEPRKGDEDHNKNGIPKINF